MIQVDKVWHSFAEPIFQLDASQATKTGQGQKMSKWVFFLFFVMFVSVLNHWSLFQDDSGALEIHGSGLQVSLIAGKLHCALSGVSHHKMEIRKDVPSNTLTTHG